MKNQQEVSLVYCTNQIKRLMGKKTKKKTTEQYTKSVKAVKTRNCHFICHFIFIFNIKMSFYIIHACETPSQVRGWSLDSAKHGQSYSKIM